MTSFEINRPERMFRRGRPIDPEFDLSENLYHRCLSQHVVEGRLLPEAIRFPDFSVNRAKYSEPEDVLIPTYQDWGMAMFEVRAIPEEGYSTDASTRYTWKVIHDPNDDNYAHSEVRSYKNGVYSKTLEISKMVKKQFRQVLSEKVKVIRQPQT